MFPTLSEPTGDDITTSPAPYADKKTCARMLFRLGLTIQTATAPRL